MRQDIRPARGISAGAVAALLLIGLVALLAATLLSTAFAQGAFGVATRTGLSHRATQARASTTAAAKTL